MREIEVKEHSIITPGGRQCEPFDLYSVHYKGWIADGLHDKLVYDSRQVGQGLPKRFQQGHYEVSKCWDLSVHLMHAGEQMKIFCPSYFVNGGAKQYAHFESFQIPPETPVTFSLEVQACEPTLTSFNEANHPMDPMDKNTIRETHIDQIVGSDGYKFTGSNTHDESGSLLRSTPKAQAVQATIQLTLEQRIAQLKAEIERLKIVVDREERDLRKMKEDLIANQAMKKAEVDKEESVLKQAKVVESEKEKLS